METIYTKLIKIGNSQGIRIPKHILKRFHLENEIELIIDEKANQIHITTKRKPRSNWEEQFQKMHQQGEDNVLIDDSFDLPDWEW